jgi:hypothetical protein
LQWKDNFTLPKPPLWFDMYALQMLFSQHEHPVFISPVYGCLIKKDQHDVQAYPHVPSLKRVQLFPGLRDLEAGEYPSSFTVVLILALSTATFAQIIYTGRNETHLGLCKNLIEFVPESGRLSHFFVVSPGLSALDDHDGTLKEMDEVPGCPKGEHVCMHRGQLVKEKAIVNELFIIKTISDFEIISGGRISLGKSVRDGNICLLATKQLSHRYCK